VSAIVEFIAESMMAYAQSLIIMLLASQASIAAADAADRTILREPAAVVGQHHPAADDACQEPKVCRLTAGGDSQERTRLSFRIPC